MALKGRDAGRGVETCGLWLLGRQWLETDGGVRVQWERCCFVGPGSCVAVVMAISPQTKIRLDPSTYSTKPYPKTGCERVQHRISLVLHIHNLGVSNPTSEIVTVDICHCHVDTVVSFNSTVSR